MKEKFQLKNDITELQTLSQKIEEISEIFNLSPDVIFKINLSLEELVTNTISYGYRDKEEHLLDIEMRLENSEVTITLIDDAMEFNPLEKDDPDLTKSIEEREIGGLGIHFVKNLMDDFRYDRKNGMNHIVLVKKI